MTVVSEGIPLVLLSHTTLHMYDGSVNHLERFITYQSVISNHILQGPVERKGNVLEVVDERGLITCNLVLEYNPYICQNASFSNIDKLRVLHSNHSISVKQYIVLLKS